MLLKIRYYFDIKGYVAHLCFLYGLYFQSGFSRDTTNPRLTLKQESDRLLYKRNYSQTVFFHEQDSNSLFVGGLNVVLRIDVDKMQILQVSIGFEQFDGEFLKNDLAERKIRKTFRMINYTLTPDSCLKMPCFVTVIEHFQNCTFACGTNGEKPKCWKLYPKESNHSMEVIDGTGISPYTYTKNSLSLVADGDLYAAAPLYSDGTLLQFRRKAGNRNSLWMHDQWLSEPTFISSFLAKRKDDPVNEKIYVLFREKNSDTSPEADPWISRVARMCKVDEGGPKQSLQNMWTSFLKARLVCGIPSESLYFNRLRDVFILHAEDWRNSRVYALFSSSWNSTAVCIYSLADLDAVFEKSSFRGYDKEIPRPRPGTCVENSNSIPVATLNVIKDYPEMQEWIKPIHKDTPFFTSINNYTKIAVDSIQASDQRIYNVLLLATDNGMIIKVLENDSNPFIISETSLYNGSAPIQSMKLDSERRKLFVGYPGQMSVLDLQRCQDYNASCQDCVLSRDPYCAWTERGCTPQTNGGIQNIVDGNTFVCGANSVGRHKRDLMPTSVPLRTRHFVPVGVPFYLSCPVDSHHATYRWKHKDKNSACQQSQSECLLLIPEMTADDYGNYKCISHEQDYTKIVKDYDLFSPPSAFSTALKHKWSMVSFVTVFFYLCWL